MHRSGRYGAQRTPQQRRPCTANREHGTFRIVICCSACLFAVQRSCRPRARMRSAIGHISGPARSPIRAAAICAARLHRRTRIGQIVAAFSLVRPAWCAARDGQLWVWFGVCRALTNRTLTPPEEAKGPWCELDRGSTLKQMGWTVQADGGNHDGCRCDAHGCRRCRPRISGDLLCVGGGHSFRVFPPLRRQAGAVSIQGTSESSFGLAAHSGSKRPSSTSDDHH